MRIVDGDTESSLRDDRRLPCQRWARRVAMVALQADIPLLVGLYMFVGDDIERILWKDEGIYCSTASNMFGVPAEKHGANHELRQKGKVAVLACGYGGSLGALKRMGGVKMGHGSLEEMSAIMCRVPTWAKGLPLDADGFEASFYKKD